MKEAQMNSLLLQLSSLHMCESAALDFQIGADEKLLAFQVTLSTLAAFPVDFSNFELRNQDF